MKTGYCNVELNEFVEMLFVLLRELVLQKVA